MASEESVTKVIEDLPAEKPSDRALAVSVGFIYQLVGLGAFLTGCGVLFAVLGGHKRLLRTFGIGVGSAPEVGLLLISLGVLILLWESLEAASGGRQRRSASRSAAARARTSAARAASLRS
jgi:hypothetical protein